MPLSVPNVPEPFIALPPAQPQEPLTLESLHFQLMIHLNSMRIMDLNIRELQKEVEKMRNKIYMLEEKFGEGEIREDTLGPNSGARK